MNIDEADRESSEELKEQVYNQIDKVEQDLSDIEGKLTPGQFIDNEFYASRARTPRATFDGLYHNPIGTTFLTIGALMLRETSSGKSGEDQVKDFTRSAADTGKEAAKSASDKAKSATSKAKSAAKQGAMKAKDFASDAVEGTKHNLREIGKTASQSFTSVKESVDLEHLSPLTLASVGLGLGASIGLATPQHTREDRLVDQGSQELVKFRKDFKDTSLRSLENIKNELAEELKEFKIA